MGSPEPSDAMTARWGRQQSDAVPEGRDGSLSLILPIIDGSSLVSSDWSRLRQVIEQARAAGTLEVLVVGDEADLEGIADREGWTLVPVSHGSWDDRARAGLATSTGDRLMVLDISRSYTDSAVSEMLRAVAARDPDLAIAVPRGGTGGSEVWRLGASAVSRWILGSGDVFSGLLVMRRSLWERGGRRLSGNGSSLVLELLLRRPGRCVDVRVPVGDQFARQRFGVRDLRSLKHVLDGRYGSFSRLIQFCCVGASGMVVDLSIYALLQWLLSFTAIAGTPVGRSGFSWTLAIAAAISISTALVWNFTLNRRLTFNDARGGSWGRQFLAYVLSNALAIALSFSLRLYLPARVGFFARHRLAAAVVGIVTATGVSFSMSRWIVFARRPERSPASQAPESDLVPPPSVLV